MLHTLTLALACSFLGQDADLVPNRATLRQEGMQSDFASLAVDASGTPWVAYVEWDTKADSLCLAKRTGEGLVRVGTVGKPGIIHQPSLAALPDGSLLVVWSQVNAKDVMDLHAQRLRDGKPVGDATILAATPSGGNVLSRMAVDSTGRAWVVWQSMRGALADVFCRTFSPTEDRWSAEVQVTNDAAGDWEPTVAFDLKTDGAWVLYDSSRGNEFNLYANRVSADGRVGATKTLLKTDRYEGRVSAVGSKDGRGIWLACERGNQQWGLDMRAHGGPQGLNGRKDSVLAYWDLATDRVEEMPSIDSLLNPLPGPPADEAKPAARGNTPKAAAKAAARGKAREAKAAQPEAKEAAGDKPAVAKKADEGKPAAKAPAPAAPKANPNKPGPAVIPAVNLPTLVLDAEGRPWMTIRYFKNYCWKVALSRFDPAAKQWTKPVALPDSQYAQDRRTSAALAADGGLWLAWLSDLRISKLHRFVGIELAKVAVDATLPMLSPGAGKAREPFAAYINPVTPERPRDARHTWTHDGTTYKLYWGDFHRHTDVSNCITANDGCVQEQFRYAYDMAKLDLLGTSDHTDIAKIYHPYEWWLNQKTTDTFYAPGYFNSMYAYEREQKWPWGHRNIIFAQRGGPIVYIQRVNYLASPWQKIFPVNADGEKELSPQELWDVLVRYGKPVTAMSHTGATGMGLDWNLFDTVDNRVENVVEIYQGARVSYEGKGAPQPTVGLREGEKYNAANPVAGTPLPGDPIQSFIDKDNGLYQNALTRGHKLGVWANSDHISQHVSFGGVYVKDFTREGILEGINARRTIAATDKIFVEFTCNGKLLGTEFEVQGSPTMTFSVDGTAAIKRVTLVRNEQNYEQWKPGTKTFEQTFVDEKPVTGENRYYLRIEQEDGNMAWSSPVWVQVK